MSELVSLSQFIEPLQKKLIDSLSVDCILTPINNKVSTYTQFGVITAMLSYKDWHDMPQDLSSSIDYFNLKLVEFKDTLLIANAGMVSLKINVKALNFLTAYLKAALSDNRYKKNRAENIESSIKLAKGIRFLLNNGPIMRAILSDGKLTIQKIPESDTGIENAIIGEAAIALTSWGYIVRRYNVQDANAVSTITHLLEKCSLKNNYSEYLLIAAADALSSNMVHPDRLLAMHSYVFGCINNLKQHEKKQNKMLLLRGLADIADYLDVSANHVPQAQKPEAEIYKNRVTIFMKSLVAPCQTLCMQLVAVQITESFSNLDQISMALVSCLAYESFRSLQNVEPVLKKLESCLAIYDLGLPEDDRKQLVSAIYKCINA